jgi:glycoside/pentoside/hexuronide:cation symporter, GPH family
MNIDVPPLSAAVKLNFGIGQIAEGIKTCAFGTFLMFYYNQVLGLAGDLAGLAIALALIFDAVTDPVAGSVSDRWQSPRGRRHPFMFASAVPLGVAFSLLFVPLVSIESVGQYGLFGWMLVATILTRGAMTLYHVPHMALGAELSDDYDERTVLVAIRHFFGATGFIIVYGLGFGYFLAPTAEFPNGQLNGAAYPPYAITMGLLMTVSILITAFGTRSRIPYMPKARVTEERVRIKDVLVEAFEAMKNDSFRWMMFGFILIIVAFGVAGATGLYMYTFFWELSRFQILLVLVMGPVGSMVGYMFARRIFAWLDKRNAMIVGGIAWMVVHALPVLLYLVELAPPPGSWAVAWFLTAIIIFGGASVGQIVVGIGTAMADIADENELLTGRRQEGVFFGASAFANKCSAALGSFVAGLILEWISWPTGSAIRTAADIPEDTLLTLAIMSGPVTALLAIPGILCLLGYRLNREKLAHIQAQLRGTATA